MSTQQVVKLKKLYAKTVHHREVQKLLRAYDVLPQDIITLAPIGGYFEVFCVFVGVKPEEEDD